MRGVTVMTDRLKVEYEQMLADHEAIDEAIRKLVDAAREEAKLEYVGICEHLTRHLEAEEQVYYPAAILVGEYLKLKLDQPAGTDDRQRPLIDQPAPRSRASSAICRRSCPGSRPWAASQNGGSGRCGAAAATAAQSSAVSTSPARGTTCCSQAAR